MVVKIQQCTKFMNYLQYVVQKFGVISNYIADKTLEFHCRVSHPRYYSNEK